MPDWRNCAVLLTPLALRPSTVPASDSRNDIEPNSRALSPVPLFVIHPRTASSFARAEKCNVINHDIGRAISDREVVAMTAIADFLREDVEYWICTNHAALL